MSGADVLSDGGRALRSIGSVPHILEILCRTTGMGFAAVARVTDERWIACVVHDRLETGLAPGDELDLRLTICARVRGCREPLVIDDMAADARWSDHPGVRRFGVRSYLSMPIVRRDGSFVGTLSAFDPAPRRLNEPGTLAVIRGFAQLIAHEMDEHEAQARNRRQLRAEQARARLSEEFVAVLGHDLRSPLASIASGLRVIEREGLGERPARALALMQKTVGRMNALIDNLLDLARGRLGEGLAFDLRPCATLRDEVEQVVGEIRAASGNPVELDWRVDGPVRCDRRRIGQLVSNLLSNAVSHGHPGGPVRVAARRGDGNGNVNGGFRLSVENDGPPIPDRIRGSLFEPFFRGGGGAGREGLGLGLYIAAEIARAHGGRLEVESAGGRTRFTLLMPG